MNGDEVKANDAQVALYDAIRASNLDKNKKEWILRRVRIALYSEDADDSDGPDWPQGDLLRDLEEFGLHDVASDVRKGTYDH